MNSSPGFCDDVLEPAMSALYSTFKVGSGELAHRREGQWTARRIALSRTFPRELQLTDFETSRETDGEERGALSQSRLRSLGLNPFWLSSSEGGVQVRPDRQAGQVLCWALGRRFRTADSNTDRPGERRLRGRMLYAERAMVPGRWRGTGWVSGGLSRPTSRRLSSSPRPPPATGVGTTAVLLFTDYFQGRERWHERVGGNDGSERRDPTRETQRWKSERHRERHRDTETRNRRDTESRSRVWRIPVSLQPRRPRHCDDNDTEHGSMPCPCPCLPFSHGQHPCTSDHPRPGGKNVGEPSFPAVDARRMRSGHVRRGACCDGRVCWSPCWKSHAGPCWTMLHWPSPASYRREMRESARVCIAASSRPGHSRYTATDRSYWKSTRELGGN